VGDDAPDRSVIMFVANNYIVRASDSMQSIAEAYTGNPANWPQLVYANPHKKLSWYRTPSGNMLMFAELREGETIFLPNTWRRIPLRKLAPITFGQFVQKKASGSVGQEAKPGWGGDCDPGGAITNVKPYVYVVGSGELPYKIAEKFGGKWQDLRKANYDDPDGFGFYTTTNPDGSIAGTICTWRKLEGKKFKIPASWSDPPQGSTVWNQIEWAGGAPPPGVEPGKTPGEIVPVGITEPVSGKEEKDEGLPTWAWVLGGLAIGGGAVFIASKVMKKRDTREEAARMAAARLQPAPPPMG